MEAKLAKTVYKAFLKAAIVYKNRAADLGIPAFSLLPAPLQHILSASTSTSPELNLTQQIQAAFRNCEKRSNSTAIAPAEELRPLCADSLIKAVQVAHIQYSVGQTIRHKKYGWYGVIIGYDADCQASEEWISAARVKELAAGTSQAFYHVLGDHPAVTSYIPQENIELIPAKDSIGDEKYKIMLPLLMSPMISHYFCGVAWPSLEFVPADRMEILYADDFANSLWHIKTRDIVPIKAHNAPAPGQSRWQQLR